MTSFAPHTAEASSLLRDLVRIRAVSGNCRNMEHAVPGKSIKDEMMANAAEICRLQAAIQHSLQDRHRCPQVNDAWKRACEIFHERYDRLAFPGGAAGAIERILRGDADAVESAVCFAELRPYFFRSGYFLKKVIRKLKCAPLTENQRLRLDVVIRRQADWKARKSRRSVVES